MRLLLRIIKAALMTFGVLFLFFVAFFVWGFRQQGPTTCERGPLAKINSCDVDHGSFTWMNSGWWYTKAEGPIQPQLCSGFSAQEALYASGKELLKYHSRDCPALLGASRFVRCFTHSRLSGNSNTKYFELIAMDRDCTEGLYFVGSKRSLLGGVIKTASLAQVDPEKKNELYPEITKPVQPERSDNGAEFQ